MIDFRQRCHNNVVAIRTTVDIPEPLHDWLCHRSEKSGSSISSLIVRAIEHVYADSGKGEYLNGSPISGTGKLGPAFPKDENPHHLVFS